MPPDRHNEPWGAPTLALLGRHPVERSLHERADPAFGAGPIMSASDEIEDREACALGSGVAPLVQRCEKRPSANSARRQPVA